MIQDNHDKMIPGGGNSANAPPIQPPSARDRFTDATKADHQTLSVRLTRKLYEEVVELARKEEMSIVTFIRRAVRRDVDRRKT